MYNVKIISLETPFTYEFDRMLCVSCMSYIITLTFGQSQPRKTHQTLYALCKLHVIYYYSNICVSCISYIITLTFGQSSIVEVDPLTQVSLPYPPFRSLTGGPHACQAPHVSYSMGSATSGDPHPQYTPSVFIYSA